MKTSDFFYNLPENLIAQTPLEPRDSSRMMVLHRDSDSIEHKHFYDIIDYLEPGDCLIVNDSRVIPARIYGVKEDTGAKIEFLLLHRIDGSRWETLVKPGRKAKPGARFSFGDGILNAEVLEITDDGNRIVDLSCEDNNVYAALDKIGQMPLPPYITEKLKDQERYQTVYSHELGSAAAPTAGLHFTNELLDKIRRKGVSIGYVTLHVGLGTFRPVKVDDVTKHKMHSEHYEIPQETADLINRTKAAGKRVIAVGTTSCRTLESVAAAGEFKACEGYTDIFIYPGFEFKALDGLITNFHLPESTLIMLVSAFYGYDKTMKAYETAVDEKYRFFSFGDCMIIL